MKKNLLLIMGTLLVLGWYVTISSWTGNDDKIQGHILEAQRLEEKGLYLDAIEEYAKVKELKQDVLEIEEYIADDYFAMGDYKEYKSQLNLIIDTYGPIEADIIKLYEFHKNYSSENSLIDCIKGLYEKYPDSQIVKDYYNSIKGKYTEKYINLDRIESFNNKYAVFELNDKEGLLSVDGKVVIEAVYDEIIYNGYDADSITVKDGDKYYFINENGYKTKEPEEHYEYMGMISQKRVVAKRNNKYGYLDSNLNEKIAFIYDDATTFNGNVAAVRKGDKWALIDRTGEEITEYIYEEVAVNSKGYCCVNDRICVKQNGNWSLINSKAEVIGTDIYHNMKAFESEELCAVSKNDKWGYINMAGELVIDYTYQDAQSFTYGFAPVKNNGLWGYIDLDNKLLIEYAFEEAKNITENGVAPIAREGVWTLIELIVLN